ncbi:formyltetrahydrofolate deformylase [Halococcus sp. IIIV-5B]|uniref:formyltetrahydrofolate deformylase n=1 Tax=Halococcus sp. IIIV-5B TaxID=2321230 RepID=UPI000E71A1B3|nr:formyltetrahydrofolate deformylase [Halococcus sp. IIIV-5B]RJT04341.1 formyltetrahydrofolate deformylase [Halococcus sp. IIIV-5B]
MNQELTEITVIGDDDTGLIARVTSMLFERDVNIEDLDQAVRQGLFRMTMRVDTTGMSCTEAELRDALDALCDDLGMDVQVRFPADREAKRIAVLATKESHCLAAMLEAFVDDDPEAEVAVVVANHDDLAPLAAAHDVPFYDIGDAGGVPDEEWLLDILAEYEVDLVALARYMRILSPNVVFRYESRIINVHPSLLPSFAGAEAYRQAIEKGVRIAGVTAHYVTTDLDQGPIIAQRVFDVPDDATPEELEERGQPLEAEALVEAVRLHLAGDLVVGRGRTHLREDSDAELGLPEEIAELNPDEPVDRPVAEVVEEE